MVGHQSAQLFQSAAERLGVGQPHGAPLVDKKKHFQEPSVSPVSAVSAVGAPYAAALTGESARSFSPTGESNEVEKEIAYGAESGTNGFK